MTNFDEDAALEFATTVAEAAGKTMLEYFQIGVATDFKSDDTPVTIADKAINEMVIQKITTAYPDHSVLGEEASNMQANSTYTWVCDPIDGTTAFSYGMPTNVFSLILTREGQPILGVVLDPYMQRLYTAQKGKGAFVNGQKMRINNTPLEKTFLGLASLRSPFIDAPKLHYLLEQQGVHRLATASTIYEGMLVASGQLGGQIYLNSHTYDAVASKLFVEEAGGKVTDLFGNEQNYDEDIKGIIATNGLFHDELLAIVQQVKLPS